MKNKWVSMQKSKPPVLKRSVDSIEDKVFLSLKYVAENPGAMEESAIKAGADGPVSLADCKDLVKRKLLTKVVTTSFNLTKGSRFTLDVKKHITDLTPEMLQDGSWKTANFRKFNLDAEPKVPAGALHPLLKVKQEFRQIFLEMGFDEMPTNQYVESSFWNFDALFQPQQHPARDAHDTFFMSQPEKSDTFPEEYLEKVKDVHENGGYGSIGYRYDWSRAEAQKNILRTHTTAVSTRMLHKLGQMKPFKPARYFSIDRVFRNESLDATHLAEFHQVEGVVADYNLTLGHLIGVIAEFFERLGMSDVKFKPAYNPYTEPSMEIFAYHPDLKKEVEVGNSGIFRPEMLRPMGLPEDVTVIAWGLSVERPTMIKYGYDNIRSLFGPGVDLKLVRDNPICQL
jgi:phenylalanyl-tRNA synthetase alpha chain